MHHDPIKIYLDLSSETLEALSDNNIDIEELLAAEGLKADVSYASLPDANPDARTKDLSLVVLTSSAAALVVGITINKILTTIFRRPQRVEYFEYITVRDSNNNIITDKDGNPIVERVKREEIIEPIPEKNKLSAEVSFKIDQGIVIKFTSDTDPTNDASKKNK